MTSLVCLAEQWTTWSGYFAPDLIVAALHALVLAGEDKRPVVQRLTSLVAAHQGEDGGWPNADLFHVLEALCAVGTPAALAAVRRAVPALAERQRPDGTFGFTAQQERALIALRAFQWAEAGPSQSLASTHPSVSGPRVPPQLERLDFLPHPVVAPEARPCPSTREPIMTQQSIDQPPRIRLTTLSHGAGCACKLGPGELAQVLRLLPSAGDARVLVDAATRDDAAVFRLSDDRALVATVDFFTPIVDDAAAWGAIAAANALSDVYAMGGTPALRAQPGRLAPGEAPLRAARRRRWAARARSWSGLAA